MRSRFLAMFIGVLASIPALASAQQTAVAKATKAATSPVITEEKPGLMAKAKISSATAIATARRVAPKGAVLSKGEIEEEDGLLIYTLQFKVVGQKGIHEINVDARTGRVVAQEDEEDEEAEDAENEDDEKPEAAEAAKLGARRS